MDTNDSKLRSVSIDGLLNSHDIRWNLDSTVNILGGRNGSGKSTILHALAIVLQGAVQKQGAANQTRVHSQALFKSINVELTSGNIIKCHREVSSNEQELPEGLPNTESGKGTGKYTVETVSLEVECKINTKLPEHIIYINTAERPLSDIVMMLQKSAIANLPSLSALDLQLEQAINERNRLFAQRLSNAMSRQDKDDINKLQDLFGRVEKSLEVFFDREYTILDISSLKFAPNNGSGDEIPYYRLSTGEKQLLYLLLAVSNTLEESTLLLLDEAETGMHIDWKEILLRELMKINPNMQILAATHSPSLIEGWMGNVKEVSQLYVNEAR